MKEKYYETCAKQVQVLLYGFREELVEINQAQKKVMVNLELSDIGRKNRLGLLVGELDKLTEKASKKIKEIIEQFCEKYETINPNTDNSSKFNVEIANALKVIEMCGNHLTEDMLRSVVDPIKSSYSAMKLIRSVLEVKMTSTPMFDRQEEMKILNLMNEYMGTNVDIERYNDSLENIRSMLNYPKIVNGTIQGYDTTGYDTLCLGENMMSVGKAFEEISARYPDIFKDEEVKKLEEEIEENEKLKEEIEKEKAKKKRDEELEDLIKKNSKERK